MPYFRLLMLLAFFTLSLSPGKATHLVGGDLSYECLGNNLYRIKMIVYRDCGGLNNAPYDNPAIITVHDGNDNFVSNLYIPFRGKSRLPVTAPNSCTSLPSFVCTEEASYIDTISLPPNPNGYVITHQRCCRNRSISNVLNSGDRGSSYTISIPPNDSGCNSSPEFNAPPPVALCLNVPVNIDASATETDGDSLHYSLCEVFDGTGNNPNFGPNSPRPDTAYPPPYSPIPFAPGFSHNNPITSSPAFSIDPQTGMLSGRPTQVGQFVFAICVEEWRNGQKISTLRRDFQFNVTNQCQGVTAFIDGQDVDTSSLCSGRTINFTESSVNAHSYYWDFGDPQSNTDTSTQQSPTYTYSDTGVYEVMLIGNPNDTCADTTYSTFRVFDKVEIEFDISGKRCLSDQSLQFTPSGQYSSDASFEWNFGGNTSQGWVSTDEKPSGISYNQSGIYVVTLVVEDFECSASYQDSIRVFAPPALKHAVPQKRACMPVEVKFRDSSEFDGNIEHFWDFGDGNTSTQAEPVHTYQSSGLFTVHHRIVTSEGCQDTLEESFPNYISVDPIPEAKLYLSPEELDIENPEVRLIDSSQGASHTFTKFPDGQVVRNMKERLLTLEDTGWLQFELVAYNEFGCTDTVQRKVYMKEPAEIFIPDAFTPNGDGVNDQFSYIITGARKHRISIFNRWGEQVFESTSMDKTWKGRNNGTGQKLPKGVYTYILTAEMRLTGEVLTKRGSITLIR